jgi:multidrug efflux pump subunit AcrB/outer membrane protein TolC
MNPVRASLRNPQIAYVLSAVVLIVGLHALATMPRREDPKVTVLMGLVTAHYPGATAEQVEEQVTRRVEDRLFRFAEVRRQKTWSMSRAGMMVVRVHLEPGVKAPGEFWSKLRHELNELAAMELPEGVLGPIVDSDFGDVLAMLIAVKGPGYGYRELVPYVERIEDELRQIPAASKLRRIGEQQDQILVTSTMERLAQHDIMAYQVMSALQDQNLIAEAGAFDADRARARLRTTGLYESAEQIRRQIVGVSPSGQPIYIGDIADVERRYADPDFLVRVNGEASLLIGLEMHHGRNIVEFGHEVEERLESLRTELPPDIEITLVADQPRLVGQRIGFFMVQFGTAMLAVILATMLLLPLRVASIAALAIPLTVALTIVVIRAIGIELHQVSLAALIVALGMVVDDATVITENYVDMLDRGLDREEAAWRSASELAGPVVTSTLAIIAAFLPLLLLPGDQGEWISALPISVSVALICSSFVAMFVTPILCRLFIRKGLDEAATGRRFAPLRLMQSAYDRSIAYFMAHKPAAIAMGVGGILAGVLLLATVEERFFPPAERDQFAMNVRLPEGSHFGATDGAVRRIEAALADDEEIVSYAAFVGGGAPRFFFSFDPAIPGSNVAQILVNTRSIDATGRVVARLRQSLPTAVPEADVVVDELQQSMPTESPVEVRVSGAEIPILRELGQRIAGMIEAVPFTELVQNNFREDAFSLQVVIKPEVANRLGMSNSVISASLAGTFLGAPASTLWEGSRAVDIVLRLDDRHRESFENVGDTYLISPVSGARVPLREIADLAPVWEPSQIVRRSGIRTLTVGAHPTDGHLAASVVDEIRTPLRRLEAELPPGYRIAFGGEHEAQEETFGHMRVALITSLIAIFLILLFTFRNVRDPLLVMVSIPLALFGAALGLVLTRNPFGFMAFMGIISLSGIVVRNGVILVEYMREQEGRGVPTEQAALEAGQRRLRPIFLTSFSAAAGLTPMILSGSGLWSPLASVLAIGILCSMAFTLIVVPVLYVITSRRAATEAVATTAAGRAPAGAAVGAGVGFTMLLALVLLVSAPAATAAQPAMHRLTLEDAVEMALERNPGVLAARAGVDELRHRRAAVRTNYLPRLSTQVHYSYGTAGQGIIVPPAAFGMLPDVGPFPPVEVDIGQGQRNMFIATTTVTQPLTQSFRIRAGVAAAEHDEEIARARLRAAEGEVAVGALRLFAAVLIAEAEREVAVLRLAAAGERAAEAQVTTGAGTQLALAAAERRVAELDARRKLVAAEHAIQDARYALLDLIGMPPGSAIQLVPPAAATLDDRPLDVLVGQALAANPEVVEARSRHGQAGHGINAARAAFVPDVSILAMHVGQNGAPFLPRSSIAAALQLEWTIWDFGERRRTLDEHRALQRQAEAAVAMVVGRIRGEVERAYRELERASMVVELARDAVLVHEEVVDLYRAQASAGVVLAVAEQEARIGHASAALDRLRAELGEHMARAELLRLTGEVP